MVERTNGREVMRGLPSDRLTHPDCCMCELTNILMIYL